VELKEAVGSSLLAPARVWVAEVDVDGSGVEIVAGEYRAEQLGAILTHGPFLEAALRYRYAANHRNLPCMIACTTCAQADALTRFLRQRRPAGCPAPVLLLGETPRDARSRLLRAFERGRIDTLIQVGVLIEGWSSPRCKLLLDLAPGRSRVRATQKYFRVLTRDGDAEAHIVVLVPRDLPRPPVLPLDLLLEPGEGYRCGDVVGEHGHSRERAELPALRQVRLVERLVVSARLGLPRLRRDELVGLLAVLRSCRELDLDALPGRLGFERLYFSHPLIAGTGRMLLRWLGVPWRAGAWEEWIARLFPEQAAARWLDESWELPPELPSPPFSTSPEIQDPEQVLLDREWWRRVERAMGGLRPRAREAVVRRFGLEEHDPHTYGEVGDLWDLSVERCRQIVLDGVGDLRRQLREEEEATPPTRGRDEDLIQRLGGVRPDWERHPVIERARRDRRQGQRGLAETRLMAFVAGVGRANAWAHVELASLLEARGERVAATSHRERALAIGAPGLRPRVGLEMYAAGRYREAVELLSGCEREHWRVADCWLRLGDPARAHRVLVEAGSWDPTDRFHLVLAAHRARLPCAVHLLWALGLGLGLGRQVAALGEGDLPPGSNPYVHAARDLWLAGTRSAGLTHRGGTDGRKSWHVNI
jgi:hypothetical protein